MKALTDWKDLTHKQVFLVFVALCFLPLVLAGVLWWQDQHWLAMLVPEVVALYQAVVHYRQWQETKAARQRREVWKLINFHAHYSSKREVRTSIAALMALMNKLRGK